MTSDVDRAAVEMRLLTAAFWAEKTLNAELRAQLERARDLAVRSGVFQSPSRYTAGGVITGSGLPAGGDGP